MYYFSFFISTTRLQQNLMGYVYDDLPQYPQPHRIIGFCNYMPRIMNNTDLCPGSGLHSDGSYVTEELLLLVNPQIHRYRFF